MINTLGIINKAWGYEEIFASNELYCGKFLYFNEGGTFSMHFHKDKVETWYVDSGIFELRYIDTKDAEQYTKILEEGYTWTNNTLEPHQLHCLSKGRIIEVSTADYKRDNYRVLPGDSQRGR